jgi:hypothetical protein
MGGSPDGEPEPSEVTPQELDENANVRVRRRDRSKWKERAEDHLKDFLPEHVRDAATAAVLHHLDLTADGKPLKVVNRDRHAQSLYLLKNVLFCKETGLPMKGRLSGDKGKEVRKYGISKGARIPRSDAPSQKCVRAEPAERAVMELVRTAVLDQPRMTEAMAKVLSLAEREKKSDGDVAKMQREVKRLRNQIAVLSDDVSEDEHGDDDPVVQKITRVRREIDRLTIAIRQAGATPSTKPHDPQEAMERLARELEEFGRKIDAADIPLLMAVLELLVTRVDVDRDTKEFEVQLDVPSWLANLLNRPLPAGLDELLACKPQIEAHPENRAILGIFQCEYEQKPPCYKCRRAA